MRKRITRERESEDQRNARLTYQRKRSASNRSSESVDQSEVRLTDQRNRSTINRLEKKQQTLLDQYNWPAAIPTHVKEYCLQDFSDHMSMPVLRQSICIICNIRAFANKTKEYALQNIPNSEKLSCQADLMNIIPKSQQNAQSGFLIVRSRS